MSEIKKVVLAYSGGLDTSVIIKWLVENYDCEVVAFSADLGQGEELAPLKKKAIQTGASKIYITDLKEEFVRDFIFPMLRAGAVYEGRYMLGTSIARPLIAKAQMDIAKKEKADAVCHGATGKGNDQVRFELTYYAINPHIKVIAPWREWDMKSRTDLIDYAERHDIPVTATKAKPYSSDRNLFHISFEGGILEDPWAEPPEDMFLLSVSPEKAPNKPTYVEIAFKDGNPIAVNGKKMSPAKLLAELNKLGGKNGIGRVDVVENRYVGMKSRGVYETPGGTILHAARRAVESITMDREVMHLRDSLIPRYAELVYYGYWYSPERKVLQTMIDEAAKGVTGTVRVKLYKGNCDVVGRKSDKSLYHPDFATFEEDVVYDQKDAEGFIKLNALRLKIKAMVEKRERP
ncbi:MAG: argininosuccinate synthase [Deltaproteobacteria bacterium GWC2_42_51]|nr:MAG: argininosuccinate synthase [Deltaproteobacteria bacterium GWC2_42_51]OGP37999.1 MAG: argininosuccinate synthase [Deltaproteobacteria bacterium GWD2_42_10]OGP47718.1 MAG: argininosuccinate synthase [Deltaproteobacteria bacterium GWF2_42_12]OGQ25221.1 MAG: argininosuccinate synthase [Deltaproteobacteria bacterium RIFCSPHIGHO2_02_FULL_42_44]OGQ37149.1 MAG: argininosuccinate synthase [Deltaproteobacteria bacterium RIFCSPLOWO2_02_FULL_42_39]OGQ64720.1 MAG: argininosuccinate synthase [Deltap